MEEFQEPGEVCNGGRFKVKSCWLNDRVAQWLSGRVFARSVKGPGFEPLSSYNFSSGLW